MTHDSRHDDFNIVFTTCFPLPLKKKKNVDSHGDTFDISHDNWANFISVMHNEYWPEIGNMHVISYTVYEHPAQSPG